MPYYSQITVRLPAEIYEALKVKAETERVSLNKLVTDILLAATKK